MQSIDRLIGFLREIDDRIAEKDTMPEREYYEGLGRYVPELVDTVVQVFVDLAAKVTPSGR